MKIWCIFTLFLREAPEKRWTLWFFPQKNHDFTKYKVPPPPNINPRWDKRPKYEAREALYLGEFTPKKEPHKSAVKRGLRWADELLWSWPEWQGFYISPRLCIGGQVQGSQGGCIFGEARPPRFQGKLAPVRLVCVDPGQLLEGGGLDGILGLRKGYKRQTSGGVVVHDKKLCQ